MSLISGAGLCTGGWRSPASAAAICSCADSDNSGCNCTTSFDISRPLGGIDADARAALRVGAYQLVDGVAPHAAVGETVAAIGRRNPRAKGFVNAVLRRLAASGPPWPLPTGDDVASIAIRTSHPDWIAARLVADLGAGRRGRGARVRQPPARGHAPGQPASHRPDRARRGAPGRRAIRVEPGALLPDALEVTGIGDPAALAAGRGGPGHTPGPGEPGRGGRARPAARRAGPRDRRGPGRQDHRHRRAGRRRRPRRAWSSVSTSTPGGSPGSPRPAARLGLAAVAPVVADGRAPAAAPAAPSTGCSSTRPAPGLGVLRRRAEARWRIDPTRRSSSPRSSGSCSPPRRPRCDPAGCSCTRSARSPPPRRVEVDAWAAPRSPASSAPRRLRDRRGGRTGAGALLLPSARGHRRHVRAPPRRAGGLTVPALTSRDRSGVDR